MRLAQLVDEIKAFQDAVDRFDAAAASSLGVNETDLRCLVLLADHGPRRPSDLADLLGLTRGATTTALLRLEAANHLKRANNANDGRSHFVGLTVTTQARMQEIWRPIRLQGAELLNGYSNSQLDLLKDFMTRAVRFHEQCSNTLTASAAVQGGGFPPRT